MNRILGFIFRKVSDQLYEDFRLHASDWSSPGFRAVAVYRFGAMLRRRQNRGVLNRMLLRLYRSMYVYIRNHYGIELPATAIVGRRFLIGHQGGIVIHHRAVIGDDCIVIQNVTIGGSSILRHKEAPKLGNRVSVGAGAVIVGKVVIGDDVNIGPNVSVLTNIPAGTTVCPPPPRLIKLQSHTPQSYWDAIIVPKSSPEQESATAKK